MTLPEELLLVRTGPDEVEIEIFIPAGNAAFAGHFPGTPILPGVVQIDWAVRLADLHLAAELGAAQDFQVKFRRVAHPDSRLRLALRLDRAAGALSFEYRDGTDVVSSGRIRTGQVR